MNGYSYEKTERELLHGAAGYIDSEMIADVISKNVDARDKIDENGKYEDDIYNSNIRPFHSIRSNLARVLSPIQAFDFESFIRLDNAQGIDFYELRTKSLENKLTLNSLTQKETEQTLKLNSKLKIPFYIDYYSGYAKFLIMMSTSSVFILLALCICIAPIFADEFQKKTDAVILSALVGGIFFGIPFESLRSFNFLFPSKMMDYTFVFSERLALVFGMYLKPYIFIPIVCFLFTAILLPLSHKSFKNHQVG